MFSLSFSPDGTKVASFSESKAVGCDERGIYHAPFTLNVKGESSEMEIKSKKDAKVSIMQMRLARRTKGFVSSARKRQDQKISAFQVTAEDGHGAVCRVLDNHYPGEEE